MILPPEIRNRIYGYVVGERQDVFHCIRNGAETSPRIYCAQDPDWYSGSPSVLPGDFRFLETCRQIYYEARLLTRTTNNYSFVYWECLTTFVIQPRNNSVRALHLDIMASTLQCELIWNESLKKSLSLLQDLEFLHVTISDLRFGNEALRESGNSSTYPKLFEGLVEVGAPALRRVDIEMSEIVWLTRTRRDEIWLRYVLKLPINDKVRTEVSKEKGKALDDEIEQGLQEKQDWIKEVQERLMRR